MVICVCAVAIHHKAVVGSTRGIVLINNGLEEMPRGMCMCGERGVIEEKLGLQCQRYSCMPRTGKKSVAGMLNQKDISYFSMSRCEEGPRRAVLMTRT